MENYDDSFYTGGTDPLNIDNAFTRFAQSHFVTTLIFAIIGMIAIIILVILISSKVIGNILCSKDSFVGSYMRWRPNVQDKSELNAIMAANKVDPPLAFPAGLLRNDSGDVETNLGSY